MQETYLKSLQIIKELKIKTQKEYKKIQKEYLILNADSLKYIANARTFKEVIKIAKEV